MFQHLAKYLLCFTLLLSAGQFFYVSADVVDQSSFPIEQVDYDQQIAQNSPGFLLVDLSEDDYSPAKPDFVRKSTCYKNSVANYRCSLQKSIDYTKPLCVSGKFNIPHHNQDKEDSDSFLLG